MGKTVLYLIINESELETVLRTLWFEGEWLYL